MQRPVVPSFWASRASCTQAGGARPVLALPGPTAPVLVGPALKEASGLHFSSFSSEAWEKNKSENHFQN